MQVWWTVIRRNPDDARVMLDWVQAHDSLGAAVTSTALTNGGFAEALTVLKGRHRDRLGLALIDQMTSKKGGSK